MAFTFKWYENSWNKMFYSQRVWIGYNIELAEWVYCICDLCKCLETKGFGDNFAKRAISFSKLLELKIVSDLLRSLFHFWRLPRRCRILLRDVYMRWANPVSQASSLCRVSSVHALCPLVLFIWEGRLTRLPISRLLEPRYLQAGQPALSYKKQRHFDKEIRHELSQLRKANQPV